MASKKYYYAIKQRGRLLTFVDGAGNRMLALFESGKTAHKVAAERTKTVKRPNTVVPIKI
jgi:hypothetical protein